MTVRTLKFYHVYHGVRIIFIIFYPPNHDVRLPTFLYGQFEHVTRLNLSDCRTPWKQLFPYVCFNVCGGLGGGCVK